MRLFPLRFPSNNPDYIETTLLKILPRKTIRIISGKTHAFVSLLACAFDYSEILHREKVGCKTNIVAFATENQNPSNKLPPIYLTLGGSCFSRESE